MATRLFPFPVLRMAQVEGGRGEAQPPYLPGAEFRAEAVRKANAGKVTITHILRGKSLVFDLLSEGIAKFACIVCVPSTMYRILDLYNGDYSEQKENDNHTIKADHKICIKDTLLSSPPLFRSLIVATEEIRHKVRRVDGLHEIYVGKRITFPEGAILAAADWIVFQGAGGLLVLREDEKLADKTMYVKEDTQHGYRFVVWVPPNLFRQLKECPPDRRAHRDSILTHALSRGLEILARRYGSGSSNDEKEASGWKEYANLRWLQSELKNNDYPDWTEEDFHAEQAATLVRGHNIPKNGASGEGND